MDVEVLSSVLGTKQYWDESYENELKNYIEHGDKGEMWFGRNVLNTIVQWISKCDLIDSTSSILDIGTGNGIFLVELWKRGFRKLTGIDYSEAAIELATKIASAQGALIKYKVENVLQIECPSTYVKDQYHLCNDKGTYDAISLDSDDSFGKRRTYVKSVWNLLGPEGLFVLTSCNWTRDELLAQFSNDFVLVDEIPMPQFQFGGVTGQTVTSVVLKRMCSSNPT